MSNADSLVAGLFAGAMIGYIIGHLRGYHTGRYEHGGVYVDLEDMR